MLLGLEHRHIYHDVIFERESKFRFNFDNKINPQASDK